MTPDQAVEGARALQAAADKLTRRQPTEVTADRLASHLDEFQDYLTNRDRRAFAQVITALQDIADGKR